MISSWLSLSLAYRRAKGNRSGERGAELVEFSLVFGFLVVFLVGIVDFGRGYKTYQNVTNATREGARLSAVPYYNQPTVAPDVLRNRLTTYLQSLGMETSYYQGAATKISGTTTWTYGNYPNGSYLLIDQSKAFDKLDGSGSPTGVIYTGSQVQLRYPYSCLFFGQVVRLLVPSATYGNSIYLRESSLIQNE
jgi:TadE-like protein